jgi:hypothetical protein
MDQAEIANLGVFFPGTTGQHGRLYFPRISRQFSNLAAADIFHTTAWL